MGKQVVKAIFTQDSYHLPSPVGQRSAGPRIYSWPIRCAEEKIFMVQLITEALNEWKNEKKLHFCSLNLWTGNNAVYFLEMITSYKAFPWFYLFIKDVLLKPELNIEAYFSFFLL